MRTRYFGVLMAALTLALLSVGGATAQRYPERRTTRFGTRDYNRGDYDGAELKYGRALELNPELREATYNLGAVLWRQSQGAVHEGMSEDEQKAVQERAGQATKLWSALAADSLAASGLRSAAGYNAGNVALAAEQLDAAIEAYKGALRLRPDDMEAKYNLAYAQLLKRRQEQNDDQNKDENKDDKGGGGDQQDPQNDQNNNDQNKDQNDPKQGDGDKDNNDGDGKDDPEDGDGDRDDKDGDGNNDGQNGPEGDGRDDPRQGGGKPKIDPRAAEQMLDAMQAAEDGTREKVNAQKVQAASHSGKNW